MPFFQPDYTVLCYRHLSPAFLRERGISVLLLDIDNTLAPYEQPLPDAEIKAFLSGMAKAGIATAFLSNNHADRVTLFNGELERPVRYDAHKPLPRVGRELMSMLGGTKENTALMGDQIFTDVLTARTLGIRAILVPPIKDRTDFGTRFKRFLEKGILRRYHKRCPDAPDVREGSPLTREHI